MTATAPALTAQESLAEAVWAAVLWHSIPDAKPGTADAYEALHDAVAAAPGVASALNLIRDAIGAGTANAGDLDLPVVLPGEPA